MGSRLGGIRRLSVEAGIEGDDGVDGQHELPGASRVGNRATFPQSIRHDHLLGRAIVALVDIRRLHVELDAQLLEDRVPLR
jgi:hypothetical protein